MKTSIRNLILAGVTGVSLISASVALAGGPGGCGGGNFGPGYSNHGPGMMMGHGWGGPRQALRVLGPGSRPTSIAVDDLDYPFRWPEKSSCAPRSAWMPSPSPWLPVPPRPCH